jgi:hypothetical protein
MALILLHSTLRALVFTQIVRSGFLPAGCFIQFSYGVKNRCRTISKVSDAFLPLIDSGLRQSVFRPAPSGDVHSLAVVMTWGPLAEIKLA